MPYNRSKSTIIRNERYLQDMHEAKRTIMWPSANPKRLAYKIREALWATQYHEDFAHYRYLRSFFEIALETGAVRARYMGENHARPVHVEANGKKTFSREAGDGPAVMVAPPESPLAAMNLKDVHTLEAAVGAAIRFRETAEEIKLPECALSMEDKRKLWTWGQTSGWSFIDHEEEGITLTRRLVDPDLLWSPE
jgi:hypothetical protein